MRGPWSTATTAGRAQGARCEDVMGAQQWRAVCQYTQRPRPSQSPSPTDLVSAWCCTERRDRARAMVAAGAVHAHLQNGEIHVHEDRGAMARTGWYTALCAVRAHAQRTPSRSDISAYLEYTPHDAWRMAHPMPHAAHCARRRGRRLFVPACTERNRLVFAIFTSIRARHVLLKRHETLYFFDSYGTRYDRYARPFPIVMLRASLCTNALDRAHCRL